jgi:hypothetical protein
MLVLILQLAYLGMVSILASTIQDTGIIIQMPTLKITVSQWQTIRADLHTEHPKTVFMIKDKMKRVLGFTVREHQEWVEDTVSDDRAGYDLFSVQNDGWYKGKRHEFSIRLDFYNERKYTMFILKYSEILHGR